MRWILVVFLVGVTNVGAGAGELHDHEMVRAMHEKPCTGFVAAIDYQGTALEDVARQAMAWGMLLGYDTARGGLARNGASVLKRLRAACAAAPDRPVTALMDGLD